MSDEPVVVEKGTWLLVWALVEDVDPHPEEYSVRFESHNEHYLALVRRDHTVIPESDPPFVPRCTSLHEVRVRLDDLRPGDADPLEEGDQVLLRCTKHAEHAGEHQHRGMKWDKPAGHIEEE